MIEVISNSSTVSLDVVAKPRRRLCPTLRAGGMAALMVAAFSLAACEADPADEGDAQPDTADSGTAGLDSGADISGADGGPECEGVGDNICVDGELDRVYRSDSCGNPTTVDTRCSGDLLCEVNSADGQGYCSCPLTGQTSCRVEGPLSTLYEPTTVIRERSCANTVDEPEDVLEECGFGQVCFHEDEFNDGEALCHRSIGASQADAPYYNFGCGTFSMWLRNPTMLEIDCRCRVTGDGQGGAGGTIDGSNGYVDPGNIDIDAGGYPGGPIINCSTPDSMADTVWPVEYGAGPNFNAWFQQNASGASWFSGDVDAETREMYAIVLWSSPGNTRSASVVAWNLDTKDRRVITGLYPDPVAGETAYGSGYLSPSPGGNDPLQPLTGANVLRLGVDGMIYTYGGDTGETTSSEREIVRIDPETGERTLVWRARVSDADEGIDPGFGQCLRPDAGGALQSVAFNAHAFEVAPDGTFYLSLRGRREGDGLVAISADASTCTVVSRWGGLGHAPGGGAEPVPPPEPIGEGVDLQFPVQGLLAHDGQLYGVSNDDLYAFDLDTGRRTRASYTDGDYSGMGVSNVFWDPSRDVVWAVGTVAKFVGAIIDLETGRRESVFSDTGLQEYGDEAILRSSYGEARSVTSPPTMLGSNANSIGMGGFILDPDSPDIVYAVLKSGGLMMMELSTFNNFVHSW